MSRSFLFVPGDSERKLAKAADCDADAIIIDLEDSVAAGERPRARRLVVDFLGQPIRPDAWVRINPLESADALKDLEAVIDGAPLGVVLPKASGAADILALGKKLEAIEKSSGDDAGITRILPIVTEHPAALFRIHEYADTTSRLAGLTWGAEDLSAALGASATRDAAGNWLPTFALARSLCLLGAGAAAIPAIDTVFTDIRDTNGLAEYASNARRDGFSGMLAIHPAQIEPINDAFLPTAEEVAQAKRIVAAFTDNPDAGVMQLDGRMIDRPHLVKAQRILDVAARTGAG